MRRVWLLFTQAVTVTLAVLFVVSLVKPDWLAWRTNVVEVREGATAPAISIQPNAPRPYSFSEAAKKAIPSVVNISATRQVKRANPLLQEPVFQRFFGDALGMATATVALLIWVAVPLAIGLRWFRRRDF